MPVDTPSDTAAEPKNDSAPSKLGTLVVLLLTFFLFLPSIGNTFAMDDDGIAGSKSVSQPGQPDPMITGHFDGGAWDYCSKFFGRHYWWPESVNDGLYRPISVLSYGLVYQAVGRYVESDNEAGPQHALNVLIHVWAVWLVIQMLIAVGAPSFVSLLTALVFGVHAIHSEVVAGIVGRAELFSFCFGAQALLFMTRGSWWRYALAGLLMFMAYGSKESSFCWIPFYFCFALTRQWIRQPDNPTFALFRDLRSLIAIGVMLIPVLIWYLLRENAMALEPVIDKSADFSSNPLAHTSAAVRIMTGIKVWGYGLWLCVAPFKLSCIYSPHVFEIVESPMNLGFLSGLFVLLAFLGAGLWFARRQPLLFLAMTCFLGFSFVTSNVPMSIGTILGERLYYIPSLGVCLLPGVLWLAIRGRGTKILCGAVALWCTANIAMSLHRTAIWEDSATLFFHDVETFPMSIDLHRKAAAVYTGDGPHKNLDKAIAHLEEAKRLHKNYAHAYRQLGKVYVEKKEWRRAIAEFKLSYEVDYADPPGAETIAFNYIGDCLRKLADEAEEVDEKRRLTGEAMTWYQKSLKAPAWGDKDGESNNAIGDSLIQISKFVKAPAEKKRLVLQALASYIKCVDTSGKLQNLSARQAFKRIFKHGVDPEVVLGQKQIFDLYQKAKETGEDNELLLLMGVAAYKAELPPEMVFEPLHMAFKSIPPDKRDLNFYTAQLFYSDALLEFGERGHLAEADARRQARGILEMLLGRSEMSDTIKGMIRDRLANDPRLR
jgi:tetratricopeptide (TPR) repeat protein